MTHTFNRRPYSVNIPADTTGFFGQSQFKGICTNKNDVNIDQTSFADANNVYVDEGGVLVSRPPFKFSEGEANIIEQWTFGAYTLRLYRLFMNAGGTFVTNFTGYTESTLEHVFLLRCISHDTQSQYAWRLPATLFSWDKLPKIICAPIEDKIFVWFAGVDFIAFNLNTLTFESATKYIYLPICKTVINGIENDLEAKNFLTSAYRRKYFYSIGSSVNFEKLVGKRMSVYLNGAMTQNEHNHLYDVVVGKHQSKALIYPYSEIGSSYHVETVHVAGIVVTLRYNINSHLIDVSFDGRYFRSVPVIEEIVGLPTLSKNGMWIMAFTKTGLAKCRLVAQETLDFAYPERVFSWTREAYCALDTPVAAISIASAPVGYFETDEQYAYVISKDTGSSYLYTQFMANDVIVGETVITGLAFGRTSNCRIHFRYIQYDEVAEVNAGAIVVLLGLGSLVGYKFEKPLADDMIVSDCATMPTFASDYHLPRLLADQADISNEYIVSRISCYKTIDPFSTTRAQSYAVGDIVYQPTVTDSEFVHVCRKTIPFTISILNETYCLRIPGFKGAFDLDTTYEYGDHVTYLGNVYWCEEPLGSTMILPTDTTVWSLLGAYEVYDDKTKYAISTYVVHEDWQILAMINKSTEFPLNDTEYWRVDVLREPYGAPSRIGLLKYDVSVGGTPSVLRFNILSSEVFDVPGVGRLKLNAGRKEFISDGVLYANGTVQTLPENGLLTRTAVDGEMITNTSVLTLSWPGASGRKGNIHRLTADLLHLDDQSISSGDVVSYTENAHLERDFLSSKNIDGTYLSNRFVIERIAVVNNEIVALDGYIRTGDLLRLTSCDTSYTIPVGSPGNLGAVPIVVSPWTYELFSFDPPALTVDSTTHLLRLCTSAELALKTGTVQLFGYAGLTKIRESLSLSDDGASYLIDGTVWTSKLDVSAGDEYVTIELDEYVNGQITNDICEIEVCQDVPDKVITLDTHYLAYGNLLEATTTKRNAAHDLMLYLPSLNENIFSNKITNMHPLSPTELGVFTEKEIWYVENPSKAPVRSKIPLGCREGDEIITALDGKALLFATARGLTVLSPQDFVATVEQSLVYITDNIQEKYRGFYDEMVANGFLAPTEYTDGYVPNIRITTYRYWSLFYKRMGNEIYALDTRDASWWIWTTPYPIKLLYTNSRLHALLEVDYTPLTAGNRLKSLSCVPFIWADDEVSNLVEDNTAFPQIGYTPIANIGYYDDVVTNTISGVSEMIYESKYVPSKRVLPQATREIDWSFTSQRLHFGKINNYKAVKGINLNVVGTETITAKMSTKSYRDFYHPEDSSVMEVEINDLRTFVKRLNLMHLINFQYKLENDINPDTRRHLKLNSLSIKYEVKEKIR